MQTWRASASFHAPFGLMFSGSLLLVLSREHERPGTPVKRRQIFTHTRDHLVLVALGIGLKFTAIAPPGCLLQTVCFCWEQMNWCKGASLDQPLQCLGMDGCPGWDKGEHADGFSPPLWLLSASHCLP